VVEHFIREASVHWIVDSCICRDASDCRDYPIHLGCLFLGEAANGINPKLGHRVSQEEALEHVQKCRQAGLVHLIGRNKLDTIWLGVGPGTQLLTICNCCPCCCLWRVLPYVSPKISAKITRMPGVTVTVSDRCVGCGTCTLDVCFVNAIHLKEDRSHINETCRGCGRCVAECPEGAIEITFETNRFVQDAIARISPLVDVE
jgi:ferredoxin